MLEAMQQAEKAYAITCRRRFDLYEEDRTSQMVVERSLEIVSEASRHLPEGMKQRHPDIPWRQVRDIGNNLRHEYHRLTQFVLWETVRLELPKLRQACEREVRRENPEGPEA